MVKSNVELKARDDQPEKVEPCYKPLIRENTVYSLQEREWAIIDNLATVYGAAVVCEAILKLVPEIKTGDSKKFTGFLIDQRYPILKYFLQALAIEVNTENTPIPVAPPQSLDPKEENNTPDSDSPPHQAVV